MKYYIRKSHSGKSSAWLLIDVQTGRVAATAENRSTIEAIAAHLAQGKQGMLDPTFQAPEDSQDELRLF
jgi:hypothetical protein